MSLRSAAMGSRGGVEERRKRRCDNTIVCVSVCRSGLLPARFSQLGVLDLELGDPTAKRVDGLGYVGGVDLLRNVTRAVDVPGGHVEEDDPLGPPFRFWRQKPLDERRVVLDHTRATPDLDPALPRVVHEEQEGAIVLRQIAERDVLPVASEVDEAERLVVEDAEKSRGAAAMLDIRLPIRAGGSKIETVTLGQEGRQLGGDRGLPTVAFLHAAVGGA